MKRMLRFDVAIDYRQHTVPPGPPCLFGRAERHRALGMETRLDAWWEVPDARFDGDRYTGPTQQVRVVGTGDEIPVDWRWLASVIDGPGVWHLYEVRPPSGAHAQS